MGKLYGLIWFLMALCVFGMLSGCSISPVENPDADLKEREKEAAYMLIRGSLTGNAIHNK